jgi:signal transduction histidine kinase/ActR/RegA family two-component response regulator
LTAARTVETCRLLEPPEPVLFRETLEDVVDHRQRLSLLADAGRLLSESLDYETTLHNLARLTVPPFADYCMIFKLGEGRGLSMVAFAHLDPLKEPLLYRIGEIYQIDPENLHSPISRVLRTGEPLLLSEVEPWMGRAVSEESELLEIFARLDPRSMLVLPLAARGQTLGVISLVMAVESDRRYGEDDLILGRELAHRAALAIDNARLYTEAEAANRAKDQFLAVLSHELRTPITPVLMTAARLAQDPDLPERFRGEVERIRRNAELQAKLIDDLQDLTRVNHGKVELHFEAVDIHVFLRQAVDVFCCSQIQKKKLHCCVQDEAAEHHVWADPVRLQQVIWNVIQNAVKFTPDQGRVEVRTRNPEPGRIRIEIADTGIGIEPDVLSRLFDAYEQGSRSVTRRYGGLGLGLALCKALVDRLGGTLTATSEGTGRGATFAFEFPAIPPHDQAGDVAKKSTEIPARRPLRILLVEDHGDTLHVMAEFLETSGHEVERAPDVGSALRLAEAQSFDLLVSDLGLPDGSGLDLMRQVRERYGLPGIAVSGYGTLDDVRLSQDAGFLDHLVKPVHPSKLKEAIARARTSIEV